MKSTIHDTSASELAKQFQKNNFKSVSKKLIIAALLVVGFSSFAQETPQSGKKSKKAPKEAKSPEQKNEARMGHLTAELNLDANQQAQIKPILVEQTAKMEAMKAQQKANKEAGKELSDAEKKEMRKKRMEDKAATDNKMKGILSSDQFAKYQAMQEAEKEKMKAQQQQKAGQ